MQHQLHTLFSEPRKWVLGAALITMATISLALVHGCSGLVADSEPFAHQSVKQSAPFAGQNAMARLDIPVTTTSNMS